MKNLLVLIIICMTFMFADKVQILGMPNIRVEPNPKAAITTNKIIYDVLDTHSDYYECKVNGTSKAKGITGWIWVGILDMNKAKSEAIIIKSGGVIRAKPTKHSDERGVVYVGDTVEILKYTVTWYKISLGWVYKSLVKLIKE